MTEEMEREEVVELLRNLRGRHIGGAGAEGHNFWVDFAYAGTSYRFEVAIGQGNQWLHRESDDGFETVFEWTRRY